MSWKVKYCFLGVIFINFNFYCGWSMYWFCLFYYNWLSIYLAILFKILIWELILDIFYCYVNEKNKLNSIGMYMFVLGYKEFKFKCLDLIIILIIFYFIWEYVFIEN